MTSSITVESWHHWLGLHHDIDYGCIMTSSITVESWHHRLRLHHDFIDYGCIVTSSIYGCIVTSSTMVASWHHQLRLYHDIIDLRLHHGIVVDNIIVDASWQRREEYSFLYNLYSLVSEWTCISVLQWMWYWRNVWELACLLYPLITNGFLPAFSRRRMVYIEVQLRLYGSSTMDYIEVQLGHIL